MFRRDGDQWTPVVLEDGTPTDGRVETYERAVVEILGAPETFFTSVFSAQGKRPLSAFRNGEVKALLADLLGLEEIGTQGARAAETARLLKAGLGVVRQAQAQTAQESERTELQLRGLGDVDEALKRAAAARRSAAEELETANGVLARLEAEAVTAEGTERQRSALLAERGRSEAQRGHAMERIAENAHRVERQAAALAQRVAARRQRHADRRRRVLDQAHALRAILALSPRVAWAIRRLPTAEHCHAARIATAHGAERAVKRVERLRNDTKSRRERIEAIQREAGQLALRQADLSTRFGLCDAVPCAGTDLQGRCHLLSDARNAQAMLPNVDAQLVELADKKREAQAAYNAAVDELARFAGAAEARNRAEHRLERAKNRLSVIERLCSRREELERATVSAAQFERELFDLGDCDVPETQQEADERREIAAARARLTAEGSAAERDSQDAAARIDAELMLLPPQRSDAQLVQARARVLDAERALKQREDTQLAAVRLEEQAQTLRRQLAATREAAAASDIRAASIEAELSSWSLLSKCLSNDGVIALEIDDAGPTLTALANDLLLACYGPRFTLQVVTQSTTAKGELREDFEIIVHDGERGESKSLRLVSGGERVWINEALTRAIALYLAANTGRCFSTLFSDEADGPLDPERKRMFMDMKREVLRLGGYAREFFVSQTPELTAMADEVLDLDQLVDRQV